MSFLTSHIRSYEMKRREIFIEFNELECSQLFFTDFSHLIHAVMLRRQYSVFCWQWESFKRCTHKYFMRVLSTRVSEHHSSEKNEKKSNPKAFYWIFDYSIRRNFSHQLFPLLLVITLRMSFVSCFVTFLYQK